MNPSSSFASSDIMSIPHGGSKVICTSTCFTPGKDSTAPATQPGISPGVKQVDVQMTFDPPWGMDMMSDEAKLELGFM